MKDYLLIFRLPADAGKPTPDQVDRRRAWFGDVAAQGRIADKGNTLAPQPARFLDGRTVHEGAPLLEGTLITGYVVLKAETLDEAVEVAQRNPLFEAGGTIEVREVAAFLKGN